LFCFCQILTGQTDIAGLVRANEDVDGIHVLNKTFLKFTITNTDGSFTIPARIGDTLTFSSLRYQIKEVLVTEQIISSKQVEVRLVEKINELDEVVVGKILTGSLNSDLANFKVENEINFYDLGIPGYVGKPKTKQERLLNEATTGGGFIPLNPILNWISGRTKRLKSNIRLEKNEVCLRQFRDEYEDVLFEKEPLEETLKVEYFYFCSESEGFAALCDIKDPVKMINFFYDKLKVFKSNAALREEVKKVRALEENKEK
jgi:hypothetical protein